MTGQPPTWNFNKYKILLTLKLTSVHHKKTHKPELGQNVHSMYICILIQHLKNTRSKLLHMDISDKALKQHTFRSVKLPQKIWLCDILPTEKGLKNHMENLSLSSLTSSLCNFAMSNSILDNCVSVHTTFILTDFYIKDMTRNSHWRWFCPYAWSLCKPYICTAVSEEPTPFSFLQFLLKTPRCTEKWNETFLWPGRLRGFKLPTCLVVTVEIILVTKGDNTN